MTERTAAMKSIWYLVGLMLMVMGVLVVAGGVADLLSPPPHATVLARLHPNLWWGCVMFLAGGLLYFTHRK